MKSTRAAVRTELLTPFGIPMADLRKAVLSPQRFHLGHALGQCTECNCPEKLLKSRALLALLSPDEATRLAEKYGLQTYGDDPMSRNEALTILGISERAVPRVLARLRARLKKATKTVREPLSLAVEPELVPA